MHVTTEVDAGSGALFAKNQYNTDFSIEWFSLTWMIQQERLPETGANLSGENRDLSSPAAMAVRTCQEKSVRDWIPAAPFR
jgi:hypothetical protein